jgi:mannose-6-phosphate isomerase-like protein (cupin superfamily)
MKTSRNNCTPYVTRDGSTIRELLHPEQLPGMKNQSLAEAVVEPGKDTLLHRHHRSEEIYHIVSGDGLMTLANDRFPVTTGDSILIPPGTLHNIANTGTTPLVLLCCCSPAYSHEDTELVDSRA